jgi:hypothetical protein
MVVDFVLVLLVIIMVLVASLGALQFAIPLVMVYIIIAALKHTKYMNDDWFWYSNINSHPIATSCKRQSQNTLQEITAPRDKYSAQQYAIAESAYKKYIDKPVEYSNRYAPTYTTVFQDKNLGFSNIVPISEIEKDVYRTRQYSKDAPRMYDGPTPLAYPDSTENTRYERDDYSDIYEGRELLNPLMMQYNFEETQKLRDININEHEQRMKNRLELQRQYPSHQFLRLYH